MSTLETREPANAPSGTATASTDLRPRVTLVQTWHQPMGFAARALKKMRRDPEQFSDVSVQPIMVPGILAMTCLTACMATGVQLREDMDSGVFDRFKSLPVARVAPLAGPMVADLVRYGIAATLTFAVGILMGYQPGGGVAGVLGAIALVVITGWSLSWAFTFVGTIARSAQSVQGISMMILFPLTFLSNAFVPVDTLPGWLAAFVKINPISHVVSAVRDLANEGTVTAEVGWALLGCALVIAVFAPLSVRSYQRER